jgi:subtilase family serine protease
MVSISRCRRSVAAAAGLGLAAATVLTAVTSTATATVAGPVKATTAGSVQPAITSSPHYRVVGQAGQNPHETTFSCQTTTPAGCYGPTQIRAAYGVDKLAKLHATGAGQTIVIIDAYSSPTIAHDLGTFNALFGLPAAPLNVIAPDGLTPFDQSDANQTGWAGEITLDVEYAHAIAPAATIDLVLAKTNDDANILSATKYAVDHHLGNVISQSFGEAEQCMDPAVLKQQHKLFAKAAARGITLLASAGDQGAAQPTCDGTAFFKAASTPASDPNVTGVGGTILDADGTTGAYHGEVVWNEPDFTSAGGGGFSTVYRTPSYQRSLGLHSRGVPDVSYNAAIIGGVLAPWSTSGQGADLVFRFGGTSAGSPQWAGLIALADQLGHHSQGAINNRLYAFAHGGLYNTLYHDITVGNNSYNDGTSNVTGFTAKRGWDAASGIGTPRADRLIPLLALTR